MQLKEIMDEWEKDSVIDKSNLDLEALNGSRLHSKYYSYLINENLTLQLSKSEFNKVTLERWTFYTEGAKTAKDLKLAPRGAVLKSEAEKYIQADHLFIDANLKLAMQQEKVNFLEDILKTISKRSFDIRNAIEFIKFKNGV